MSMYALNMLVHFRMLSETARLCGASAELHLDTMRVEVAANGRYMEFVPEFITPHPTYVGFSEELTPDATGFTGWRHGPRKRWELANDKLAFKAYCAANQLRTPRAFDLPERGDVPVIVKDVHHSGRGHILGPIVLRDVPPEAFQARNGTYVEEFIHGDVVQAWYWNGTLIAVEGRKKPRVTGDGRSNIRELIECGASPYGSIDWATAESVVHMQGTTLDAVLPAGKELLVDIRFWSALQPDTTGNQNILPNMIGTPVHQQLVEAGPGLWRGIPETIRDGTLFRVSGVIDPNQQLWFVDMDNDIHVDPHAYGWIIRTYFGVPIPLEPPPPPPAPQDAVPMLMPPGTTLN